MVQSNIYCSTGGSNHNPVHHLQIHLREPEGGRLEVYDQDEAAGRGGCSRLYIEQPKLPQLLIELVGCGMAREFRARGCVKGM